MVWSVRALARADVQHSRPDHRHLSSVCFSWCSCRSPPPTEGPLFHDDISHAGFPDMHACMHAAVPAVHTAVGLSAMLWLNCQQCVPMGLRPVDVLLCARCAINGPALTAACC